MVGRTSAGGDSTTAFLAAFAMVALEVYINAPRTTAAAVCLLDLFDLDLFDVLASVALDKYITDR